MTPISAHPLDVGATIYDATATYAEGSADSIDISDDSELAFDDAPYDSTSDDEPADASADSLDPPLSVEAAEASEVVEAAEASEVVEAAEAWPRRLRLSRLPKLSEAAEAAEVSAGHRGC